jgi:hypothetical protein
MVRPRVAELGGSANEYCGFGPFGDVRRRWATRSPGLALWLGPGATDFGQGLGCARLGSTPR